MYSTLSNDINAPGEKKKGRKQDDESLGDAAAPHRKMGPQDVGDPYRGAGGSWYVCVTRPGNGVVVEIDLSFLGEPWLDIKSPGRKVLRKRTGQEVFVLNKSEKEAVVQQHKAIRKATRKKEAVERKKAKLKGQPETQNASGQGSPLATQPSQQAPGQPERQRQPPGLTSEIEHRQPPGPTAGDQPPPGPLLAPAREIEHRQPPGLTEGQPPPGLAPAREVEHRQLPGVGIQPPPGLISMENSDKELLCNEFISQLNLRVSSLELENKKLVQQVVGLQLLTSGLQNQLNSLSAAFASRRHPPPIRYKREELLALRGSDKIPMKPF